MSEFASRDAPPAPAEPPLAFDPAAPPAAPVGEPAAPAVAPELAPGSLCEQYDAPKTKAPSAATFAERAIPPASQSRQLISRRSSRSSAVPNAIAIANDSLSANATRGIGKTTERPSHEPT